MATFARKCQEVFMATVLALHLGKPVVDVAAVEIPVNHLLDIWPPESILS